MPASLPSRRRCALANRLEMYSWPWSAKSSALTTDLVASRAAVPGAGCPGWSPRKTGLFTAQMFVSGPTTPPALRSVGPVLIEVLTLPRLDASPCPSAWVTIAVPSKGEGAVGRSLALLALRAPRDS